MPARSTIDPTESGAVGDGRTNDTRAIQVAIDTAHENGGGTVAFPPGRYLSGTIHLRDNVTLRIDAGVTLLGHTDRDAYDAPHLILAEDQENIAIVGEGTIDGQGEAFWVRDGDRWKTGEWRPGRLLQFERCRRVIVRDVRIVNSPAWTIRPLRCDDVVISGVTILNDPWGPNTDGIDPDCSRNVRISDCHIVAGDDCIVVKTLEDEPCENITVTNCTLETTCAALKLGTETRADIRHCVFSNCVIRNTAAAIALYAKDGGTLEHIHFSNISIETAAVGKYQDRQWPILIDLERRNPDSEISTIRDVLFRDISIITGGRILIQGMKNDPVERIRLENVTQRIVGYDPLAGATKPRGGRTSWQDDESGGNVAAPAHIIFTYGKDIALRNVRVVQETEQEEDRTVLFADTCEEVSIEGLRARQSGQAEAVVHLKDTRRATVRGSRALPDTSNFLKVDGESADIRLHDNDLADARAAVAPESADVETSGNRASSSE